MGTILINAFNQGGISDSIYSGIKNSLARMVGFDIHSTPGILKVNQKMSKMTTGVVPEEFCKASVDCSNGIKYWFSSTTGKIWQDKAGTLSLVHTVTLDYGSVAILSAIEFSGYIYFCTQDKVLRIPIGKADGASNWTSYLEYGNQSSMDLIFSQNIAPISTYTLPTSISESATNKFVYTPTESMLKAVGVSKDTTGTGDWTVTVHDSGNNVIASKTITNANIASSILNDPLDCLYFPFTTPVTLDLAKTYHIHVTVSTGTSRMGSSSLNDLTTGTIYLFNTCDDTYHPMKEVNLVLYIGDKNMVHMIDGTQQPTLTNSSANLFVYRNALDVPTNYRITALGKMGTDLLVGTKISDIISKCEIFRWNTYGTSFISSDTVEEPGINAFLDADNYTMVNAGLAGNIYYYDGAQLIFYKKIPGSYSPTAQCKINNNAVALFNGFLPIFGISNVVGDPCDEGIWSMGKHSNNYPIVLNMEHPTSNIDASGYSILTGIEIGAIMVSAQDLYQSWRRSTTVTMTIASPCVLTYTAHGLSNGNAIVFSTTGALPTGLTAGTTYYVRSVTSNTLNLYDTAAHAVSGGATGRIDTSGTQSGVHTAVTCGIDKLDYSTKLGIAILETRVISPAMGQFTNFSDFATSVDSLPASTSIVYKYGKNGDLPSTNTDAIAVPDSQRMQYSCDISGIEARTLQFRVEVNSYLNTAPGIQEVLIGVT